ncbi:MAG: tRNA uridine-5-carboxymethylaminomethyl(34) synthesis GTPase MnmE [Chloroflexota bacterium]|nr:tRNA uridine-5-carboxymethylaminomethyl(34) synthesis GTPase MnmE [Chloroflexota bacterium]
MDDTIAAISTPLGEGGIGIVRLSGPEARSIAKRLFQPHHKGQKLRSYRLHYGHIVDPADGTVVDEVLVSFMRAPHSYTRQDVVEINCHGGVVPLRRVLQLTFAAGARPAEPGELTLRAFLNGRIDLAQAEAVLDIVRAKTSAALRVAIDQLSGHLSDQVRALRKRMVDLLAYLEATVDFPEDEIPSREVAPELEELEEELTNLLEEAQQGLIYRQGVRAAIVGRPNVGKSSLLNALLRTNRAIVTPIPGTTRDTLEESCNLQGIPMTLVDTAGIGTAENPIEEQGIERSRQALAQADLVLLVVDGSEPLQKQDWDISDSIGTQPTLVVVNKQDLSQRVKLDGFLSRASRVHISALTGKGLDELEQAVVDLVLSGSVLASQTPLVSNPRHQALLQQAREGVRAAQDTLTQGLPSDFVAIDLTEAITALGKITGQTVSEDLLESIFANFCVGK